jgi:hypothetical protein
MHPYLILVLAVFGAFAATLAVVSVWTQRN